MLQKVSALPNGGDVATDGGGGSGGTKVNL